AARALRGAVAAEQRGVLAEQLQRRHAGRRSQEHELVQTDLAAPVTVPVASPGLDVADHRRGELLGCARLPRGRRECLAGVAFALAECANRVADRSEEHT